VIGVVESHKTAGRRITVVWGFLTVVCKRVMAQDRRPPAPRGAGPPQRSRGSGFEAVQQVLATHRCIPLPVVARRPCAHSVAAIGPIHVIRPFYSARRQFTAALTVFRANRMPAPTPRKCFATTVLIGENFRCWQKYEGAALNLAKSAVNVAPLGVQFRQPHARRRCTIISAIMCMCCVSRGGT